MDSAFIGQISSDSITVTNANIQNLSINGDKMMVDAVTSIGSYETNYYGWRDNNSYAWLYPGGSEWSAPRATVRTGNGDSKALITIMGVWERDGSDDDNVNVSIERRGGSSGTTYLSERVNVQVANGRRTFGFQWVDNYLEDYVDYTYILVFRKIGGDGSPYWHNATFNVVCFKK
jgi:hypothetical protein